MANVTGGGTAMKSVIAQLGERQQLASKVASSDRPSPASTKPSPAGKKPTQAGAPGPRRVALKPPPSTNKPTVPDLQPAPPSNKRLPVTAQKPSGMPQPASASAGQTENLSPSRLKPTIAAKPPAASLSSVSTPPVSESGDEACPVPPWQNLRKKNVPPTPMKKRASASSVTQTTGQTASSDDVEFRVGSSVADDSESYDSEQSTAEDRGSSVAAKVRSLKKAFEGPSRDAAEEANKTASSGRGSKIATTSTSAATEALPDNDDRSDGADQDSDQTLPARAASLRKAVPQGDTSLSPSRQPISGDSEYRTSHQEIVVSADGRRYRRLPPPDEPTTRPARKPAKPPAVDLTPHRSFATPSTFVPAAGAVDDEIYDDAVAVPLTHDSGVTHRSSVATGGRQGVTSVVSQIAEYTEEEEEMEKRARKNNTAVVSPPVSQSSDDVYDDVGTTQTTMYDDEIYQELD